jgi:hypothetical protein
MRLPFGSVSPRVQGGGNGRSVPGSHASAPSLGVQAPLKADFQSARRLRPVGRLVGRMNSASRGLRPTVGLRRPGRCLLRRRRPTRGAERLGRPISNRREGLRRPGGCLLRRRRPTPGAQRLRRPISIGVKAFGRRSACTPNSFGPQGPSADGRPAPTGKVPFASAEADAWRGAPLKADFNRREGRSALP